MLFCRNVYLKCKEKLSAAVFHFNVLKYHKFNLFFSINFEYFEFRYLKPLSYLFKSSTESSKHALLRAADEDVRLIHYLSNQTTLFHRYCLSLMTFKPSEDKHWRKSYRLKSYRAVNKLCDEYKIQPVNSVQRTNRSFPQNRKNHRNNCVDRTEFWLLSLLAHKATPTPEGLTRLLCFFFRFEYSKAQESAILGKHTLQSE